MKKQLYLLCVVSVLGLTGFGCATTKPRGWDFRVVERSERQPFTKGFYERVLGEEAVNGWQVVSVQVEERPSQPPINEKWIRVVLERPKE